MLPYCNFVVIISIESCIIYFGLKISSSSSDVQEITWFFANGIQIFQGLLQNCKGILKFQRIFTISGGNIWCQGFTLCLVLQYWPGIGFKAFIWRDIHKLHSFISTKIVLLKNFSTFSEKLSFQHYIPKCLSNLESKTSDFERLFLAWIMCSHFRKKTWKQIFTNLQSHWITNFISGFFHVLSLDFLFSVVYRISANSFRPWIVSSLE